MTDNPNTTSRRLVPLIMTGLLVTTGFFGFMPALGDDHWDPEPPKNPETGRFVLDLLDEFDARGEYGQFTWEIMYPENWAAQRDDVARPSFLTTDRDYMNIDFHTTVRTPTVPSNDNGFLGFVVNFNTAENHEYDTIIIDWSAKNLTWGDETVREGLTMYHIEGVVPDNDTAIQKCFFEKNSTGCHDITEQLNGEGLGAQLTVLHTYQVDEYDPDNPELYRNWTEDRGWVPGGEEYEVRIKILGDHWQEDHTPGIIVSIKGGPEDGYYYDLFKDTVQSAFDVEPAGIGFYTLNQGGSHLGAARYDNPEYYDAVRPVIEVIRTCPDGELHFGGWCSAPVALEVNVWDDGSGVKSVECTINGAPLEDCDRDHEEPGVFNLDLNAFEHTGPTGNWVSSATEATQTESAGGASFYTSQSNALPRDGLYLNVDYLGEVDAPPSGANNNMIGWAFGLTRPTGGGTLAESYIIDWKAEEQTHLGHTAPEGFTFYRIDGSVDDSDAQKFACYWGKDPAACDAATGGNAQLEILAQHTGPGTGWEHDASYTFRLEHYEDRVALTIQGGTNYVTETTVVEVNDAAAFEELGHFGAFNFRQEDVTYRNLQFEELGQQIAIHGAQLTVEAVDWAGNKAIVNQDLKIDLLNPLVSAIADCTLVNGWCNDGVALGVSASALSGILSTNCELNGVATACSQTLTDDGAYTFTANAISTVKRSATDSTAFLRDATPPEGAIVEPVSGCSYLDGASSLCLGTTTVMGDVTFNVTATDPIVNGVASGLDRVEFYENGDLFSSTQSNGSGWFNATWNPSGIGQRTVEVHLIDLAGNKEILEYDALVLL